MGIYRSLERRASPENPSTSLANPDEWLLDALGAGPTASGARVGVDSALGDASIWDAVVIIAEDVGTLPLFTYRRLDPRGKERATDHANYRRLKRKPNPFIDAVNFWQAVAGRTVVYGNFFAEIERDQGGRWRALWPLSPTDTRVALVVNPRTGRPEKKIDTRIDGEGVRLPSENVFHVSGFGLWGPEGLGRIRMHRETIGAGLAAREFAARFFGQGTVLSGLLTTTADLNEDRRRRLKQEFRQLHEGLTRAHRFALLEGDLKYEQLGVAPEQAQMLQARKFHVLEVARIFRMPPHKLGDLDRAIQANVENMQISYMTDTLRPWLVRIESAVNDQLFLESEQDEFFAEFLAEAILRGDLESRSKAHSTGRQWGWLSANDVREIENMNPIEGGDIYMVPLNMVPADSVGPPASTNGGRSERSVEERQARSVALRDRLRRAHVPVFAAQLSRLQGVELAAGRRALKRAFASRAISDFRQWIEDFYPEHRRRMAAELTSIVAVYFEAVGAAASEEVASELGLEIDRLARDYSEGMAARWTSGSVAELRQLLRDSLGGDLEAAISGRFDEWEAERVEPTTTRETVQGGAFVALSAYSAAGVRRKVWRTVGENCPLCDAMEGRVVAIERPFVREGETVEGGDATPLTVDFGLQHPPLHGLGGKGGVCDCMVSAAI